VKDARFLTISWEEIHDVLFNIAERIIRSGLSVQAVVGVMRGGWIPARIISDLLGVSEVGALEIKFYKGVGERAERPVVTQPLIANVRDKEVLVIDDVADTGKSLQTAVNVVGLHGAKTVYTATLFVKPWSTVKPDFFYGETDKWVVFPWELREVVEEYVRASYKVLPRVPDEISRITEDVAAKFGMEKSKAERVVKLLSSLK